LKNVPPSSNQRSTQQDASEQAFASPFVDISDLRNLRPAVWRTIDRLYRAAQLAADCEMDRVAFCVDASDLFDMGLWAEEMRWLNTKRVIDNTTTRRDGEGLVITDLGIELMEQCLAMNQLEQCLGNVMDATSESMVNTDIVPRWDNERHELSCAGKLVKKFKWRAANQEAILAAFQEDGWPAHIDDPLPQEGNVDPKRRLADAIKSLNRHQRVPLIRFCGDGTGEGVLWEFKR
jgi:hypothetical protein